MKLPPLILLLSFSLENYAMKPSLSLASSSHLEDAEDMKSPRSIGLQLLVSCRNGTICKQGGLFILKDYLEQNPDLTLVDDKGSALMWLCRRGNLFGAELLLDAGASVDTIGQSGYTALHAAVEKGPLNKSHMDDNKLVELLIQHGADLEATAKGGATPLHMAAFKGWTGISCLLIKSGAKINEKTRKGYTPLHYAVQEGHGELVSLLITLRASMNLPDCYGRTPLHVAAWLGHVSILEALIIAGSEINPQKCRVTPLDVAFEQGHQECIEVLQYYGASCAIKDQSVEARLQVLLKESKAKSRSQKVSP